MARDTIGESRENALQNGGVTLSSRIATRDLLTELVEDSLGLGLPIGFGQGQKIGLAALACTKDRSRGAAFFRNAATLGLDHQLGKPGRQRQLSHLRRDP